MGGTVKMNALRSGVVVIGSIAFGYLSLKVGFKPFLEKAQLEQQRQEELYLQQLQANSQRIADGDGDHDNRSYHSDTARLESQNES